MSNTPKTGTPKKGDRIRVVGGRKFPVGTLGLVKWVGETHYGLAVGFIFPEDGPEAKLKWMNPKWVQVLPHEGTLLVASRPEGLLSPFDQVAYLVPLVPSGTQQETLETLSAFTKEGELIGLFLKASLYEAGWNLV